MILIIRDYFEQLLNIISAFEKQKIELSLRRDFTLMSAYNQFSRSMQAKLTIEEFMFGLDRLDIISNPNNV